MRALTQAEIESFLDSRPGWMALTTLDPDGYPHTVAMGYFLMDGHIYMGCRPDTRKVENIRRRPQVACMLESGRANGAPLTGVMIQGDARVLEQPEELLSVKRRRARQLGESEPTEVNPKVAYIQVTPVRWRSWHKEMS